MLENENMDLFKGGGICPKEDVQFAAKKKRCGMEKNAQMGTSHANWITSDMALDAKYVENT